MVHTKKNEVKTKEKEIIPQEENLINGNGPFELIQKAVKNNEDIVLNLRNNRKMVGRVRAFDRHMNLILEDVVEKWIQRPKSSKNSNSKGILKERTFRKLFVRGDGIILVLSKANSN